MSLKDQECVPCRGGVPPVAGDIAQGLLRQLHGGWEIVRNHHLSRTWIFPDFKSALTFTNALAEVAESQGHHPDIHLAWGKVGVEIWTHKIDGLTESDFILAAKFDAVPCS
jgi:4a-hydroxytetrahydrobiopterin dehydratase